MDSSQRPHPPRRSEITTRGLDRAPHRAFMRGQGLDDKAMAQPMIGVVTTTGDTSPCNANLGDQAAHAVRGVAEAGDRLLEPVRRGLAAFLTGGDERPGPRVVAAELGNQAGLVGAADLFNIPLVRERQLKDGSFWHDVLPRGWIYSLRLYKVYRHIKLNLTSRNLPSRIRYLIRRSQIFKNPV